MEKAMASHSSTLATEGGGSATPTGTSGGLAGQLGPLPIQRATEPMGWLLPGTEAFSWERGSLLRGPLNWARASSAKTRGFHSQLDEGPETP